MSTQISLIIIIVCFSTNVYSECGTPAIPKFAGLVNDINDNEFISPSAKYEENAKLKSKCGNDYFSVGPTVDGIITCKNNEWIGSIRKCGIQYFVLIVACYTS